jgi:type IV pilus assembly protein PilB
MRSPFKKAEDRQFESESDEDPDDLAIAEFSNQEAPIINLVNKLLTQALIKEASEILIEPLENQLRLRFRIDGILQDFEPQLPPKIAGALINRCKIIADLDIAKRKIPQFSKFHRLFKNRRINFHINTLPIATGEKVAIKIFDNVTVRKFMDSVIVDASIRLIADNLCSQRSGLIIVTGTNDASISMILYSLLDRVNHLGKSAYTVEEQITYPLPDTGITQIEVRKNTNMVDTLRSLRQHKPEFVMVKEIASPEVCEAILEIAANCTVLTTLPANHSVTALSKLMAMANPAAISTVLNGIIFQYALPQLCSACYIPDHATKEELVACKLDPKTEPICYRAEIFAPRIPSDRYCGECKGTGYYQRHINAFEIMPITDDLRIEIAKGTAPIQIRQMAIDAGMQTLLAYSHDLLKQGYTSLGDIARMVTDTALPEEKEFNTSQPTSTFSENPDSISSVSNLEIRNFDPEEIFLSIVDTLDLLDFSNRELIAKAGMDIEIFASYQYMREQLLRLLQKSGITCIETVGKTFDPNFHELVTKKNTVNNHPTNTILTQFKRGYMLGDRVLRRAEVEVAVSLI